MKTKLAAATACCIAAAFSVQTAHAATFEWRIDTPGVTTNPSSLVQTVDGITVTASGFTAELGFEAGNLDGFSDANVVGPFPTTNPDAVFPPFDIDPTGVGGQLGLVVSPAPGVPATGSDRGSAQVSPGFDSGPYLDIGSFGNRFEKFDFALFQFSEAVDLGSVIVDDVSNSARDAWFAYGTEAPDFSSGFLDGLATFAVINSGDDASDGPFTHDLGIENLTYLLVGAPPSEGLGSLTGGDSNFFIDSLVDVTLSATKPSDPSVSTVPLPAGIPLMLTAFLGFGLVSRRQKSS